MNRYSELFQLLVDACKDIDADLIIAGDLFDKSHPTLHELKIAFQFFNLLNSRNISTYVIGGNHETISKGKDTYDYLEEYLPENIIMISGNCFKLHEEKTTVHFRSHCDLDNAVEFGFENYKHVLITHFRTNVGEYIKEEVDTKLLCDPFDIVIAGDIHSDLTIDNLYYTNQPINTQFESSFNTGYLLVDIDEFVDVYRVRTDLSRLVQINTNAQELPEQLTLVNTADYYRINVEGSLKELREIKISLPNVKLNKIPIVENALVEDGKQFTVEDLPLDAQIVEYLKMLQYSDSKINDLLHVWEEI